MKHYKNSTELYAHENHLNTNLAQLIPIADYIQIVAQYQTESGVSMAIADKLCREYRCETIENLPFIKDGLNNPKTLNEFDEYAAIAAQFELSSYLLAYTAVKSVYNATAEVYKKRKDSEKPTSKGANPLMLQFMSDIIRNIKTTSDARARYAESIQNDLDVFNSYLEKDTYTFKYNIKIPTKVRDCVRNDLLKQIKSSEKWLSENNYTDNEYNRIRKNITRLKNQIRDINSQIDYYRELEMYDEMLGCDRISYRVEEETEVVQTILDVEENLTESAWAELGKECYFEKEDLSCPTYSMKETLFGKIVKNGTQYTETNDYSDLISVASEAIVRLYRKGLLSCTADIYNYRRYIYKKINNWISSLKKHYNMTYEYTIEDASGILAHINGNHIDKLIENINELELCKQLETIIEKYIDFRCKKEIVFSVFEMKFLFGYTDREIASVCDISERSVRRYTSRFREISEKTEFIGFIREYIRNNI